VESGEADGEGADAGGAAPLAFWRPGSEVMSVSWVPSSMGPVGLAGQEPGGLRAADWPKGMVPGWPTGTFPTKVVGFAPLYWHWKRPVSSVLLGACWQYGTLKDEG
jgi:hypothetical protein